MGCLKLTYNPEKPTLKVAHSIFNNVKKSSAERYMYGYQGSEKDNEVNSSNGTSYTTEFRQLDTRLGRWFSSDPVFQPWQSSYTSMDNNPVNYTDVRGLDPKGDGAEKKSKEYKIKGKEDPYVEIPASEYDPKKGHLKVTLTDKSQIYVKPKPAQQQANDKKEAKTETTQNDKGSLAKDLKNDKEVPKPKNKPVESEQNPIANNSKKESEIKGEVKEFLDKTGDARNGLGGTTVIIETSKRYADKVVENTPKNKIPKQPKPVDIRSVGQTDKLVKLADKLGKTLGVISIIEHGVQLSDAIEKGDESEIAILSAKLSADVILLLTKSNPYTLGFSVIYLIYEVYEEEINEFFKED